MFHVKQAITLALGLIACTSALAAAPSGAAVFQASCASCHALAGKNTRIAPPAFGIKNHVMVAYPEREAFIAHVMQWIKAPNAEKTLMPGAVRQFGLMPALPHLSATDRRAVAEFLYETAIQEPRWYQSHYEEEHGKKP
ncbi:MAG: hypothetical protein RIR79_616 [Pseudomonadota bacterium]|jgi:mono/diheme cytochrome c family protein